MVIEVGQVWQVSSMDDARRCWNEFYIGHKFMVMSYIIDDQYPEWEICFPFRGNPKRRFRIRRNDFTYCTLLEDSSSD